MSFIDRVLKLLDQQGVSKNKMLVDLHLSKNSIVDWNKRGTIPNGETLSKIAAYFNVSTDYLLGSEQKSKPSSEEESLSPEAISLSKKIDRLSPANRAKLDELVDLYLSAQGKKK